MVFTGKNTGGFVFHGYLWVTFSWHQNFHGTSNRKKATMTRFNSANQGGSCSCQRFRLVRGKNRCFFFDAKKNVAKKPSNKPNNAFSRFFLCFWKKSAHFFGGDIPLKILWKMRFQAFSFWEHLQGKLKGFNPAGWLVATTGRSTATHNWLMVSYSKVDPPKLGI